MFSKRSPATSTTTSHRQKLRKLARRRLAQTLRWTHRRVGIEWLEDRHLLAVVAPMLGTSNESLAGQRRVRSWMRLETLWAWNRLEIASG